MPAVITEDEVRHIALLSRLKLDDEEVAGYTRELSAILDYMNQLEQVDVTGCEPTAHAIAVHNVFREDVVVPSVSPEIALANAPDRAGSFFKVPKVLDQETL